MKEIPLSQGKVALVDDADYKWLMQWKWSAYRKRNLFYAARKFQNGSKRRTVLMHRGLLPDAQIVDHKDGNGLNNQRDNLRAATHSQNLWNRGPGKNNTSGFKGVISSGRNLKPWKAQIQHEGATKHLGNFTTPELAARAFDAAALKTHGEFAKLNFPL